MAAAADALHAGDSVRIRGERWRVARRIPHGDATLLEVSGGDRLNRGIHAVFLLPFETIERLAVHDVPRVVRPTAWRRIARAAIFDATPTPDALRTAVRARIASIPFQLEPALAVLSGRATRLLIADAVGLGKTIQAGLIVAEVLARQPDGRALIVCPAGLREQWQAELAARFFMSASIIDPAHIARVAADHGMATNPWAAHAVAITSIDYVKRAEVMRSLEPLLWDVVVFDEAHALAGASDRAAAATLLGARARRLIMLTATPHSGDDATFRRLCGIGALTSEPPLLVFRRSREDAGIAGKRRTIALAVRPTPAESAMHRLLVAYARRVWADSARDGGGGRLAVTVLMRRACSSAASLARSVERRIALLESLPGAAAQLALPFAGAPTADEEPDAVLAAPGLHDGTEERLILTRLLAVARAAAKAESKIAALRRVLRRVREPVLVFTEYRDTLAQLAAQLTADPVLLHGGMPARQRRAAAFAFTHGSAALMLATDAASEGLNLHTRCRVVINLELPWMPLRLEQRIGRVDRIGQARTVHALNLVARGSGEEHVLRRLSQRLARAQGSLAGDGAEMADEGLRQIGRAEADRIEQVRRFREEDTQRARRPALCVVRTRRRAVQGRCWAWRLTFTDDRGLLLWESLLPLWTWVGARHGPATARQLAAGASVLAPIVATAQSAALDDVARTLRRQAAALQRREHTIRDALQDRHARLAAALLQPGLFDRRVDRAAAAQAELLADALSRSDARLRELDALAAPRIDECRLVFAVALQ
jgi:superfamily II DNA or RNA helicase